ncbi:MAG: REP element-mobilizing transposase RayT [Phycisphaerales bacterium]|jgi:REP element-mobilizing transposase RayT
MGTLAYFLTWTTYGTWLHGDDRGSNVDLPGRTVRIESHSDRRDRGADRLAETAFVMDDAARGVVDDSIRRHAEKREWNTLALNVRSNHVHVVVVSPGYEPEVVAGQFKSWATRGLREDALIGDRKRVWTKNASTRWINSEASLLAAVDYTLNRQ